MSDSEEHKLRSLVGLEWWHAGPDGVFEVVVIEEIHPNVYWVKRLDDGRDLMVTGECLRGRLEDIHVQSQPRK